MRPGWRNLRDSWKKLKMLLGAPWGSSPEKKLAIFVKGLNKETMLTCLNSYNRRTGDIYTYIYMYNRILYNIANHHITMCIYIYIYVKLTLIHEYTEGFMSFVNLWLGCFQISGLDPSPSWLTSFWLGVFSIGEKGKLLEFQRWLANFRWS